MLGRRFKLTPAKSASARGATAAATPAAAGTKTDTATGTTVAATPAKTATPY
jgi:hypothetical protein